MTVEQLYALYLQHPQVCTDTRSITPGCMFFALKGERFNGNLFAAEALQKGAAYVIIDEGEAKDVAYIKVESALQTLQQLATYHRKQLRIPVIGIGGSNGKTTTKELTASVLQKKFRTLATRGNFNNHIGVPLTLLEITQAHEIAVIELGTNHPGEIELLCNIALPDYGLITNIGKEHLEGFGSLEGVALEESQLYLHLLRTGGTAFVSVNDPMLVRMAARLTKKITYGYRKANKEIFAADHTYTLLESIPEIHWEMEKHQGICISPLSGEYNFSNIAAAATLGKYFGVPEKDIADAVASYRPQNSRSQWIQHGSNHIFLDCYNANPSSMQVALESFSQLDKHPKIAVVGDMFELGDHAAAEHEQLARLIATMPFDKVFCVGAEFSRHASLMKADAFATSQELAIHLATLKPENSWFIFKASRGVALEKALEGIN